jgi:hypothetical protein
MATAYSPLVSHPATVMLSSNLGEYTGPNGDLTHEGARASLASGLCGNLALALHRLDGRPCFFVTYHMDATPESLSAAFAQDPDSVFRTAHVVAASTSEPGNYCDSYGHRTPEDIEDYYGSCVIVPATPAMVEYFATRGRTTSVDLRLFAESAAELDRLQEGYSYSELDEYSDQWDEEDAEGEDGY